jgi:hypothetical protein
MVFVVVLVELPLLTVVLTTIFFPTGLAVDLIEILRTDICITSLQLALK